MHCRGVCPRSAATRAAADAGAGGGEAVGAQQPDLGQGKHCLHHSAPVGADRDEQQVEGGGGPHEGAQQAQQGAGSGVARSRSSHALLGSLQELWGEN